MPSNPCNADTMNIVEDDDMVTKTVKTNPRNEMTL
jgi:hypothetical protein